MNVAGSDRSLSRLNTEPVEPQMGAMENVSALASAKPMVEDQIPPISARVTTPSSGAGNLPGLDAVQSRYARIIAKAARTYGLPIRGCEVAIVTAIVESNIRVYANKYVAESLKYPHDAVGSDHDSVGIFQQRPIYWGTVKDCMDPTTSAGKFYAALKKVAGWQNVSVGTAAQKVQKSAFPLRYDQQASKATAICRAAY
ncbi:unnamed protein product [Didymodactylos carnosus]|uniref:Uncharacterized protein n=1 Tax=Didymodactylos carnosus TaxID=1234261 RepID=A0A814VCF2_9BILA|nr:unnamed protein product [Didymodactylos carnosus]CAF1231200.1 unnamed protein product [Didymodactylos carnosus]CAF3949677.1 unnamed protein product [Didymodactylos carnosus]CAF4039304.1 unnamed protein product [Didymodactylos carnosus]